MRVAASIRASDVNVLVACNHDNIAGFAIMRYGDDDAHLDLLAVAPPYRRAGVGRQLLEWLEKCAVVAGIFNVALEVRAENEGAQLFYKRMGYRTLVQLPGYYQGIEAAIRWAGICLAGLWTTEFAALAQGLTTGIPETPREEVR